MVDKKFDTFLVFEPELVWPGKPTASISSIIEYSTDPKIVGNSVIVGDSLDISRKLVAELAGKTQLVYLDPPFNTGTKFVHYQDSLKKSDWLTFIHQHIVNTYYLLAEQGTVWLHLDDKSVHRARCILDEVFGEKNFIADLTVEINPKGRQLGKFFAGSHDRILVYAKNIKTTVIQPGTTETVNTQDFPKTEPDGRKYRLLPLRNTNKKFNPVTAPTMAHTLYGNSETGEVSTSNFTDSVPVIPVFGDGTLAVWRWSPRKVETHNPQLVCRQVKGRTGYRTDIFQKDYWNPNRTKKLKTVWLAQQIGSSDEAKIELKKLGVTGFDTPKPERLMKRIIEVASQPDDLVIDLFAGSGTTAAVAHKMGRRWIVVEKNSDTVTNFINPRLNQVVDGSDQGGVSKILGWTGGEGYDILDENLSSMS